MHEPVLCFDADATTATFSRFAALNVTRITLMEGTILNARRFDEMLEPILAEDAHCVVDTGTSSFVVDGDKALIAFAEAEGIEYELIIASKGEHVHEKVLHIQNVNAYGGRFKQWLNRFNGVATKYLPSYLGWRRWLEKGEEIITPQTAFAAALG